MLDIPLTMVRPNLENLPDQPYQAGFSVRTYQPGNESEWARIENAAGAFKSEAAAMEHFAIEFAPHAADLESRMFFLEHERDGLVGTTTAWMGSYRGSLQGRIHWVGIVPEFQGQGLSKPLLNTAIKRLHSAHNSAYLTTETTSYRGINLYLGFGFEPVVESELDRKGWQIVGELLGKTLV